MLGYFLNPEEKFRLIFNIRQNSKYNLLDISTKIINGIKHENMTENYPKMHEH